MVAGSWKKPNSSRGNRALENPTGRQGSRFKKMFFLKNLFAKSIILCHGTKKIR
jgi:hypothetical protein